MLSKKKKVCISIYLLLHYYKMFAKIFVTVMANCTLQQISEKYMDVQNKRLLGYVSKLEYAYLFKKFNL